MHSEADATVGAGSKTLPNDGDLHSEDPSISVGVNKLQEVNSKIPKSSSSQHNRSPSPPFDPASAFAFLGLETSQHSFTPAPQPKHEYEYLDELRYQFIESVINALLPKSENSQVELELTTSIPSTSAGINAPNVPPLTSAGCKKSSKPLRKRKKEQKDDRAASKFKKLKRVSLTETTTTVEEMEHSNNEPMECEDSSK